MKSFFSISDPEKAATNSASRQCTYIHPSLPPSLHSVLQQQLPTTVHLLPKLPAQLCPHLLKPHSKVLQL